MASEMEEAVRRADAYATQRIGGDPWRNESIILARALLKLVESRKHLPDPDAQGEDCVHCYASWPCPGWKEGE